MDFGESVSGYSGKFHTVYGLGLDFTNMTANYVCTGTSVHQKLLLLIMAPSLHHLNLPNFVQIFTLYTSPPQMLQLNKLAQRMVRTVKKAVDSLNSLIFVARCVLRVTESDLTKGQKSMDHQFDQ